MAACLPIAFVLFTLLKDKKKKLLFIGLMAVLYTAIVRIRYARGKIVWKKRNFSVSF